jgi:ABC-2 type transport system ATP-binding protein
MCDRVAIIKEGQIVKVEKISTLKENNHKRFKLETKSPIEKGFFNLPGVTNMEVKDHHVSFLYSGNINIIMKKLSEVELMNLWIEEPDLEEIFMHYYEKEK